MERGLLQGAARALLEKKWKRNWYRVVGVLACVVVFCTIYALILLAITLSTDTICGQEEHTHTESCYLEETVPGEIQFVCTRESAGIHVHNEACYNMYHVLICGYSDQVVHEHSDICYDENGTLICTWTELKVHQHEAACYAMENVLICESTEEDHVHDDSCYEEQSVLVCTDPEVSLHTHDEDCFEEDELVCEIPEIREHVHTADCTEVKKQVCLVCEQEEHTHSDSCYGAEETENSSEDASASLQETSASMPVDSEKLETGNLIVPDALEQSLAQLNAGLQAESDEPEDDAQYEVNQVLEESEDSTEATETETQPDNEVASGTSGNITWCITNDSDKYVLELSGSGAMNNYSGGKT